MGLNLKLNYLAFVLDLILISLVFGNAWHEVNSNCDDWEPFHKEKCLKIVEVGGLKNFDEAFNICRDNRNSTLLTVRNEEEQRFLTKLIFETNKVPDGVWIGLRRNKNTGQFEWVDKSPLTFTNWAKDYPVDFLQKSGRDCVQMTPGNGFWNNYYCVKKNVVVCQRSPVMTMFEMQKKMAQITQEQVKMVKHLEVLRDAHQYTSSIPVGFIYVQLPNQLDPKAMFPNTEWQDISYVYAGLFFRTSGGNARPFGEVQEEASPRISEAGYFGGDGKRVANDKLRRFNVKLFGNNSDGMNRWSDELWTGGEFPDVASRTEGSCVRFRLSTSEVRPRNAAVRIWKRMK